MKILTILVLIAMVSMLAIAKDNPLTTEQVAQINAAQIDFLTSQATINSGVCQQANGLFQASQAKFKQLQASFCGDGTLENAVDPQTKQPSQSQWQCKPKAPQPSK